MVKYYLDIMLAGRNLELLSHLGHLPSQTSPASLPDSLNRLSLIYIFRQRFNDHFSSTAMPPSEVLTDASQLHFEEEFKSDNPLLNSAFSCLHISLQRKEPNMLKTQSKGLHTPPEFFPLFPLFEHSLLEPIRCKQRLVSKALLEVLYKKCSLRIHILALRRIHLMQAGDLMDRFSLQLFQKVVDFF